MRSSTARSFTWTRTGRIGEYPPARLLLPGERYEFVQKAQEYRQVLGARDGVPRHRRGCLSDSDRHGAGDGFEHRLVAGVVTGANHQRVASSGMLQNEPEGRTLVPRDPRPNLPCFA